MEHIFNKWGFTMRYITLFLILSLVCYVLLFPASLNAESTLKVGFIDSQRIIEGSIKGKEAMEGIKNIRNENVAQIEALNNEIETLKNELRKKEFALTAEGKAELEEKIRKKYVDLKKFQDEKELELKDTYLKKLKDIEREVIDIVQKIGREEGFSLILGRDESGIIFADPQIDLTDKVIQLYDKPSK
ncbi:MAG: OmpH family outer membrane protein [bacterium]